MSDPICPACGNDHSDPIVADTCLALREAAATGAQPTGVPLRVYGGYLEARAALRAQAHASATQVLQWLLSHIAEERGARPELTFEKKLRKLRVDGVIAARIEQALFEQALSDGTGRERAWALMSIVEHALHRLYLTNQPVASLPA